MNNKLSTELMHHGVLGMKWGVRRYQNSDGTLTALGRKRLNRNSNETRRTRHLGVHDDDIIIKRGTEASRVVNLKNDTDEESDAIERNKRFKYYSFDNVLNRGVNGRDFYARYYGENGWNPKIRIDKYKVVKDLKVANGKKVMDQLIDMYKDKTVGYLLDYLGSSSKYAKGKYFDYSNMLVKDAINNISSERSKITGTSKVDEMLRERERIGRGIYAEITDMMNIKIKSELFNRLNKMGYDAIEDVYDLDTSLPVIMINDKGYLKKIGSEDGKAYFERHGVKYINE